MQGPRATLVADEVGAGAELGGGRVAAKEVESGASPAEGAVPASAPAASGTSEVDGGGGGGGGGGGEKAPMSVVAEEEAGDVEGDAPVATEEAAAAG
jgi:hypothetical protein